MASAATVPGSGEHSGLTCSTGCRSVRFSLSNHSYRIAQESACEQMRFGKSWHGGRGAHRFPLYATPDRPQPAIPAFHRSVRPHRRRINRVTLRC